jgi:membrane protease YdiL (CAAX protease family)
MKKSIEWVKAHPMATFFTLTLALMYLLLFPVVFLMDSIKQDLLQLLVLYAVRLVVYGPVLVGILVTRWTAPERSLAPAWKRWLCFGIVWLVALVVYVLDFHRNLSEGSLGWVGLTIISIPIAILPAYVVSSAFGRITSLREHLSTLVHPRGHWGWYLVALLTFPVLQVLGLAITQLFGAKPRLSEVHVSPEIVWATLLTFASVFFYSGGINEEGGWRGFAQRRLQGRYCPLAVNLLLWVYLVLWHIPNDIIQYREGGYLLFRFGLYPSITILFGWIYNRTQGSILAPALFHASMNSMNTLQEAVPGTNAGFVILILFSIFAILSDRMWRKLPANHPAVFLEGNAAHAAPVPGLFASLGSGKVGALREAAGGRSQE